MVANDTTIPAVFRSELCGGGERHRLSDMSGVHASAT